MRRVLLVCAAVTFALACTDNITEPVPERTAAVAPPVSFATTTTEDGLSISTDKDDYQPGDTVLLTGSGWEPGDVLDIVLTDEPQTHDPHTWTVAVGADGTFHDATYVVDQGDLDVKFTLVATSRATGRSLTVQFTDGNPGAPTAGVQSPNPVTPGGTSTYTVTVNFGGNSDVCTVVLSAAPTASPSWPAPPPGGFFSFAPSSLSSAGASGGGVNLTSTLTVTVPAGMAANTYKFRITADQTADPDDCQGNNEVSGDINLVVAAPANVAPVVDAGGPYSGNRNTAISLGGATATDADGDALTFTWTYAPVSGVPVGTTCSFSNAAVLNPTFTCTNVGIFKVTLSVNDGHGHVVSDDAQVTVFNSAPTANAGPDYTGTEGSPVTLNGSATDPDGDPLTYKWTYAAEPDVDAGATCSFDDDTKKDAKITCTDDGTFKLTLTVKDSDNETSTDVADLVLSNANPTANAGGGASGYSGNEGSAIALTGSKSDPGSNDTHTYLWTSAAVSGVDAGATCSFSDATVLSPTITCTDDGTFKVTLTVTDDDLGTGSDDATLTLANVDPVAEAGGGASGYLGDEGSPIQLHGSATDAGSNDTFTWSWVYTAGAGFINGATCSFDDATAQEPKITCNDNGTVKLTLTVTDDNGGNDSDEATLAVANVNPVANAGGPYSGNEGAAISLTGSKTDAGFNDTHTYLWTYAAVSGVDGGATCGFDNATVLNPTINCTDDGTYKVTLTVTDDDLGVGTNDATLTLANVNPVLSAITAPLDPANISMAVAVSASFTDQGTNDTHTGLIDWGDGTTSAAVITESSGSGTASGSHLYSSAGVYTIKMTVTDDDLGVSNESVFQYVVVFDPSAGFVTGGGWINSPVGAYPADPSLVGKANFGFVSKYITQKDKTTPVLTGNTVFQFHAASFDFKSTSYEWLVVQGSTKASYKGEGIVNGGGSYGFLLSVVDGGSSGDKFRIKIWNKLTSTVVYDNQLSATDDATASQLIAGGSIVIHTKGGLATK